MSLEFQAQCYDDIGSEIIIGDYATLKEAEKAIDEHKSNHPYYQGYKIVDSKVGYNGVNTKRTNTHNANANINLKSKK